MITTRKAIVLCPSCQGLMQLVHIRFVDGYELQLRCQSCKINRCLPLGLQLEVGELR